MKKKIEALLKRLQVAVRHNPAEVVLSVLFCCFGCALYETSCTSLAVVVHYFPVLFLVTCTLNSMTVGSSWRFAYYLSVLFFIPFFWEENDFGSIFYWVTLVVVQLLYLVCDWRRDNDWFVRKGLCYLRAVLSAGLLAGIAWLLSISIYYSIQYIFEIWQYGERRFMAYSSSIAFIGILPLLFLLFNREKEESVNKLFEVLLNYVLSPALLIYAVILYLYFIKVILLWSLPKGAVAYIVVSFVSATFILKSCQSFLERRYYDWFYRHSGWAVLPALVMYWVGAFYRINQYGYTEERVYLVVVGAILTGTVLLFFFRRTAHYLYAAVLAAVLLSLVTYIPGITAGDIERASQEKRDNYPIPKSPNNYYEYVTITDYSPLDVTGYETLQTVGRYDEGAVNSMIQMDTFYLCDKKQQILFEAERDSLLFRQMEKAGLAPADSIPEDLYPAILRLDLDSALYVLGEISVYRSSPDSAYTVSYMGGGYYLKKRVSLPTHNK
ncbi:DUF4153 domain-containing protein [Parabacteroides sp.]